MEQDTDRCYGRHGAGRSPDMMLIDFRGRPVGCPQLRRDELDIERCFLFSIPFEPTDAIVKFSSEPQVVRFCESFGEQYGFRGRPSRRFDLVLYSTGTMLGSVLEESTTFAPRLSVRDMHERPVLWIEGPTAMLESFRDVVFTVKANAGRCNLGSIVRVCKGYFDSQQYRSDIFELAFPIDQDPRLKIALIAAAILIDSRFFEPGGRDCCIGRGGVFDFGFR